MYILSINVTGCCKNKQPKQPTSPKIYLTTSPTIQDTEQYRSKLVQPDTIHQNADVKRRQVPHLLACPIKKDWNSNIM